MGNLAHKPNFDTFWCFGTCFTWGFGCRPQFEYYKKYKQEEDDYRWTTILAKHYSVHTEIKATPAKGTNFTTIRALTQELLNIKPNDIVLIELVNPQHILRPNPSGTKIEDLCTWNLDWDKHWDNYSEEDKKAGINYWERLIKGYEKPWLDYFTEHVNLLRGFLLHRGIKSLLWYSEWEGTLEEFDRIKDHTNGEIDDYHYSWKGHKQVAEYLRKKIDNEEFLKRPLV